jgi:hypothetical protein
MKRRTTEHLSRKACADAASKQPFEFSGIVIWRIADRQAMERQAYLQKLLPEQA